MARVLHRGWLSGTSQRQCYDDDHEPAHMWIVCINILEPVVSGFWSKIFRRGVFDVTADLAHPTSKQEDIHDETPRSKQKVRSVSRGDPRKKICSGTFGPWVLHRRVGRGSGICFRSGSSTSDVYDPFLNKKIGGSQNSTICLFPRVLDDWIWRYSWW